MGIHMGVPSVISIRYFDIIKNQMTGKIVVFVNGFCMTI